MCARGGDDGVELVRGISRAQWTWLDTRLDGWIKPPLSSYSIKSIEDASRPIVGLLRAAAIAGDRELQSTIVERLTTERDHPVAGAIAVLRAAAPHGAAMLGLDPLRETWTRALTTLVATPPRAPGDWSITTKLGCKCELCARLGQFLCAAHQQQLEWPLAQERRAHVHGTITSYELPVIHVTRRVGSPYTLVLAKTQALYSRDAAERVTWARDLTWLHESAAHVARARQTTPNRNTMTSEAPHATRGLLEWNDAANIHGATCNARQET